MQVFGITKQICIKYNEWMGSVSTVLNYNYLYDVHGDCGARVHPQNDVDDDIGSTRYKIKDTSNSSSSLLFTTLVITMSTFHNFTKASNK